jgi:hypothetical protein
VPVKADLWVDGARARSGDADLQIGPCDGYGGWTLAMTFHGGRWYASIDTSGMDGTCYEVHAWTQGLDAGSFRLLLRGDPPTTNVRGRDDHRHGGPHHLKPKPKPEHRDSRRPKPGPRHSR